MVGTAEYQVGWNSAIQAKNSGAVKRGVHATLAPASSDGSTMPLRPCAWNRGMTFRQRSLAARSSAAAMLDADTQRLVWVSATIFACEVEPVVCSTKPTSSGWAKPCGAGHGRAAPVSV